MSNTIPDSTLEKFTTFGDLLRFLRRRLGITQLEFSIQVGYSDSQISRLEQNMRLPDPPTIEARFVPALCLEDEPRAVARLLELAAAVRREDAPALGMCPYKGLDFFDESDADLFVGREALTEKLVSRILSLVSKADVEQPRFFAVVGASGSGKSSLVRAGLIPALRWDKASAHWPIHILTPTAHPLQNLADALTHEHGSYAAAAQLMDDLASDHRSLSLYAHRQLKSTPASHLLIVIDQFEELFSLCRSEHERQAFIDNLLTAASTNPGGVLVIITLRADFYAHCASFPGLRSLLAAHQEYIGAMSDAEMHRAIEEPARRGRWEFEPGLVDLILHDVGHEPGALPLLSHALLETWQRRHARCMTLSGYISAGGVRGAIAETAEAVFTDQFSQEQQRIARRIFIRLTELGDETSTGDTRRRATLGELISRPEEAELTQAVIKALTDARLITTSEDAIQVAHEALIREWPTLRLWLEENREGLRLHRNLTNTAQDWHTSGREPDLLFRGARLAQAREWASANVDELNAPEREFLDASIASSEREAAEREAQRQRELAAAQRLAHAEKQRLEDGIKSERRLRLRSILISVVSTIAVILAVFALYTWQRSASQAALNRSRDLAAAAKQVYQAGKGDLALAIALEATRQDHPSIEAISTLRELATSSGTRLILPVSGQPADLVTISPDGHLALSSACAQRDSSAACALGELTLWNLDARQELRRWKAHNAEITAIAFTQAGQVLVSGAGDGSLILWNAQGQQVRQLTAHQAKISGVGVFTNSSLILSASMDGWMFLWETRTGEILQRFRAFQSITALAVSAGKFAAITIQEDGSLMFWNLNKTSFDKYDPGLGVGVRSTALSSDASWFMALSNDSSGTIVKMIDIQSGELLNRQKFACSAAHLTLNHDSTSAFISCQTALYILDIQDWKIEQIFLESPGVINDLAISNDGRLSITVTQNGTLNLLNLRSDLEFSLRRISANALIAADISADGKSLFLNDVTMNNFDQPGILILGNTGAPEEVHPFDGTTGQGGLAISPDGRYSAVAGLMVNQKTTTITTPAVLIWERQSKHFSCNVKKFSQAVNVVSFSPDSQYLAAGTQNLASKSGELSLWDVKTCQLERQFANSEDVSSLDFNHDGTRLLTGSASFPRAILWDVATGEELSRFLSPANEPVSSVMFGPGETSVLGSGLGALYLWDIKTGQIIRTYSAQSAFLSTSALSPDGRYVLASTLNGDLVLWDFSTGEELRRLNTQLDITAVLFSPDSQAAYAIAREGQLVTWHIADMSLAQLLDWVRSNRYIRDLTCAERQQYHVDPQCKP